jgi:hypothetical protein
VDTLSASIAVEDPCAKCLESLHSKVRDRNVSGDNVALGDSVEHMVHALERDVTHLIDRRKTLLVKVLDSTGRQR